MKTKNIAIFTIVIFLFCSTCFSNEEIRTRSEKHFSATQNIHFLLEEYAKELGDLRDEYIYREDRLPIDELMLQLFPVLIEAVDKTRHNVWTINRLLYAEIFHERLDQYSPKAAQVILTSIKTTIEFIDTDIASLKKLPQKAPSFTDTPVLSDNYNKTISILEQTKRKLQEILRTESDNVLSEWADSKSEQADEQNEPNEKEGSINN